MTDETTRSAIEADLGVGPATSSNALTVRSRAARNEVARLAVDIRRHTDELLAESAPESLGRRILDAIVPSPIRAAKRRAEVQIVEARLAGGVAAAEAIYGAQTDQVRSVMEGYTQTARLQTAKEIAERGLEAAAMVDDEVERTGSAFDRALDVSVAQAGTLSSASARHAAADRIQRRIEMRATVEEAAMERVRDAVRLSKTQP